MAETTIGGIMRQTIPVLLFVLLVQIGSGLGLGGMEDDFRRLSGLVVMVPPMLGLRGNISGGLASRLGTALHGGIIEPRFSLDPELKENLISAILLTVLMSVGVGVLAFLVTPLTGATPMPLWMFIGIALIAGLLSSMVTIFLTVAVAFLAFRRGWDPDNITSPVMAAISDLLVIWCILLALIIVEGIA